MPDKQPTPGMTYVVSCVCMRICHCVCAFIGEQHDEICDGNSPAALECVFELAVQAEAVVGVRLKGASSVSAGHQRVNAQDDGRKATMLAQMGRIRMTLVDHMRR
eukprot:2601709-Rhodomonas_salina.4